MFQEIEKQSDITSEIGAKLPEMAALFFDELSRTPGDLNTMEMPDIHFETDLQKKVKFLRLPRINKVVVEKTIRRKIDITTDYAGPEMRLREDPFTQLRSFILSLSHAYNNILMGIMGHVTLINMDLKDQPEHRNAGLRLEQLIQTGANLINLILGYLVERRLSAKRLQLIQLFGDFDLCPPSDNLAIDIERFKDNMRQIAAINDQSKIITAVARVLWQLLVWVQDEIACLEDMISDCPSNDSRMDVIHKSLGRGFAIVKDLQYSAGAIQPVIQRSSLKSLIRQHLRRLKGHASRIALWEDVPKRLPWVYVDRKQVDLALRKIIDNALEAMPGRGSLSVRVRTLKNELPSERCAVHSGGDYAVITIADSGRGMDILTQGRMFQPFFKAKASDTADHQGMGLSAARGIIKAHGGYIQVRSAPDCGTRIKIYLPYRRAATVR